MSGLNLSEDAPDREFSLLRTGSPPCVEPTERAPDESDLWLVDAPHESTTAEISFACAYPLVSFGRPCFLPREQCVEYARGLWRAQG